MKFISPCVLILCILIPLHAQDFMTNYNHSVSIVEDNTFESFYLYTNNVLERKLIISNSAGWKSKSDSFFSSGYLLLFKNSVLSKNDELFFDALHMNWEQLHYSNITRNVYNNLVSQYTFDTEESPHEYWEIAYDINKNPIEVFLRIKDYRYKYLVKQDNESIIIGNTTFNNIGKDQLEKELNKGLVNNFYYIIDNEELYKDNIINGKYNFDQMLLCLTKNELYIFRNTIFAYYGYIFQSQKLKKMFSQYDWYRPEFNNNTCIDRMSEYNKLILEEIQKYEKK